MTDVPLLKKVICHRAFYESQHRCNMPSSSPTSCERCIPESDVVGATKQFKDSFKKGKIYSKCLNGCKGILFFKPNGYNEAIWKCLECGNHHSEEELILKKFVEVFGEV